MLLAHIKTKKALSLWILALAFIVSACSQATYYVKPFSSSLSIGESGLAENGNSSKENGWWNQSSQQSPRTPPTMDIPEFIETTERELRDQGFITSDRNGNGILLGLCNFMNNSSIAENPSIIRAIDFEDLLDQIYYYSFFFDSRNYAMSWEQINGDLYQYPLSQENPSDEFAFRSQCDPSNNSSNVL